MCATCHAHLIRLDLTCLMISGDDFYTGFNLTMANYEAITAHNILPYVLMIQNTGHKIMLHKHTMRWQCYMYFRFSFLFSISPSPSFISEYAYVHLRHPSTLCIFIRPSNGPTAQIGLWPPPFEVSQSHTIRHTAGLLCTSDQPVAEASTYTGQHNI
jgi:hypothetical protein